MKCLFAMEIHCTKPVLQGKEGPLWFLWPKYRKSLAVKKKCCFPCLFTMGLGFIQVFDDAVEPGCSQTLDSAVCEMDHLPWL